MILIERIITRSLFTGFWLLFSVLGWCQSAFKAPVRQSARTQQVIETDSGYIGVGQFLDFSTNRFGLNLLKLDPLGHVTKEQRFLDSSGTIFPSNHISLERTLDGNFVTVFDEVSIARRANGILKFDTDLDTLALWNPMTDTIGRGFYNIKQLPDSGFVITGFWYDQPKNMYHANLILTDKNGQLIWEKVIKRPDSISLWPYQVYPAPDGGFLLAGHQVFLADFQTADPLLIRTDSAGNVLWQKTYGGPQVDGIAAAAYRDDGDIMLFYSQGTHPIQQGHSLMPTFSIVDDQSGQELQKKTFPFIDYRDFQSYNLLKDGNKYIGVGEFGPEGTLQGGARQGYTIAVDENLDDIWFRNYYAQNLATQPDDWTTIYDLRKTSDGGYIGGGYLFSDDTTNLNIHLGFNGWIVKMDSMGCVEQTCVNRIGTEEPELEEEQAVLEVFPNPSAGVFHLRLGNGRNATATLYDLKGQKLQETELIRGVGILNPQVNIPPGMYLVQVRDEAGSGVTKKLILQE